MCRVRAPIRQRAPESNGLHIGLCATTVVLAAPRSLCPPICPISPSLSNAVTRRTRKLIRAKSTFTQLSQPHVTGPRQALARATQPPFMWNANCRLWWIALAGMRPPLGTGTPALDRLLAFTEMRPDFCTCRKTTEFLRDRVWSLKQYLMGAFVFINKVEKCPA